MNNSGLRKTIDLVLYSNFLIALCAASLAYQVYLLEHRFSWNSPFPFFLFFATLFIYSIHRVIGFTKLERTHANRRISIIVKFQHHIISYSIIAFLGMVITSTKISLTATELLIVPGLLALLYVAPVLKNKRRIRDLPYLKLFLVGLVWTWVCVVIPINDVNVSLNGKHWLLILEKLMFLIAITLPFDIRDLEVDQLHNIKTIPAILGIKLSKILSVMLLVVAWICVLANYLLQNVDHKVLLALSASYIFSVVIVIAINNRSHDYYFSGLLDSTILVQFLLLWIIAY